MNFRIAACWTAIARRAAILALPLGLAACNQGPLSAGMNGTYASLNDASFTIPAVDTSRFKNKYLRQTVSYSGRERPGTVIIDTDNRFLYYILPNRKAIRYGIGVGKEGMTWAGVGSIGMKKAWPTWTPTANMVKRDPKLKKYLGGFKPGIGNPLGARAHYLYLNGRMSNYRIHGTAEPYTIGTAVSSGCIRMLNHDVIDLYKRTKVGTKVIVRRGRQNVASLGSVR
ncbi:MAG: L,D-transpeptidase [Beijerinckiaceae bacterium]